MGNVDHLDHLDRIQEEFEGGRLRPTTPSQPGGTGGLKLSPKVITAPYIGMLIILIMLAGSGRYLQRNSRGGLSEEVVGTYAGPGPASSVPRRDEPAAPVLDPLDVAARPEAVGHLQDLKVVDPQQTEEATEDPGQGKSPPEHPAAPAGARNPPSMNPRDDQGGEY